MSLTGGRRAQQFADLLDAGRRSNDPDVAPLATLAEALRAVPAPAGPSADFRVALRQRLVAVATVQGAGAVAAPTPTARLREVGSTWRFQRRMSILAGSAAAITAIAGVGIGASRSLPGQPFYGVKRATEDAQLAATFGQEAKGKRHLEFARTRLSEVEALAGRADAAGVLQPGAAAVTLGPLSDQASSSLIVKTLADMDAETRTGAEDLFAVYRANGSAEPLRALDAFTSRQFTSLRQDLAALPQEARTRAGRSLELLHVVATRVVSFARAGKPARSGNGPGGGTPGSGTPAPSGTPTPTGTPTHRGGGILPSVGPSTGPSSKPNKPGTSPPPQPVPTTVPSIPSLPTVLPLPSILPTAIPTLPHLKLKPLG